jgi:hypothetical protein
MEDAQAVVVGSGCCCIQVGRNIVPRLCPFCYHNKSLPKHERIETYKREGHLKHVVSHLKDPSRSRQRYPLSPTMCTEPDEMDGIEMENHLNMQHGFNLPARL